METAEQKSISPMKDLRHEIWKQGQLVLGLFAATFSNAKLCLIAEEYCRFVGFENDIQNWEGPISSLVEVHAFQLLNLPSHLAGNDQPAEAGRR